MVAIFIYCCLIIIFFPLCDIKKENINCKINNIYYSPIYLSISSPKFFVKNNNFWKQYNNLNYKDRSKLIWFWVQNNLITKPKLVRINIQNNNIKFSYEIMPQVFSIENKSVVMSAELAQKIGNYFNLELITREVLAHVYNQAKYILPGGKSGKERLGSQSYKLSSYSQEMSDILSKLKIKPDDMVAGQYKEIFKPIKGSENKLHAAGWLIPTPFISKNINTIAALQLYRKNMQEWEIKARKFDSSVLIQSYHGSTEHLSSHEEYCQAIRYMGKIYINIIGFEESFTLKELENKSKKDIRYLPYLLSITGGKSYSQYYILNNM